MALIRALNSAISGMKAQQFRIDVVGDNLANSTTTGFKATRVNFHTLLSQTISFGSAPQGNLGGINPKQLGLGVAVAQTTKDFSQGELEATGVATDLGIEGDGFFILKDANARQVFTRDGTFELNSENKLTNPAKGMIVQGINADLTTFTIPTGGELEDLYIPVGELQIAVATTTASYSGNLDGGGEQALQGTILESSVFHDGDGGPPATESTLLTNLYRVPETGGPDIDLGLSEGDTIIVKATKGGRTLPERVFRIGTSLQPGDDGFGTTLGEFADFLERALGINTGDAATLISAIRDDDNNPETPGVTGVATSFIYDAQGRIVGLSQTGRDFTAEGVQVNDIVRFNTGAGAGQISVITAVGTSSINFNPLSSTIPQPNIGDAFSVHEPPRVSIGGFPSDAGRLRIAGNVGTANDITRLEIVSSTGTTLTPIFIRQTATGESTIVNATFYDSIGNGHLVELALVLETKGGVDPATGGEGNVFRFFAEAKDSKYVFGTTILGSDRVVGTGTITFTTEGQFLRQDPSAGISLVIPNEGATTPLTVKPDFSKMTGFGGIQSEAYLISQDGFPMGTMIDFSISADGIVTGIFSNGLSRTVAQIMLARFANPNGLQILDSNTYMTASNSGQPIIGTPGTLGIGNVRSGVLEASNVDFAREFTTLIIGQRAFQANARVIRIADEILQDLVQIL
jgi:flagellar hook protein FlgE